MTSCYELGKDMSDMWDVELGVPKSLIESQEGLNPLTYRMITVFWSGFCPEFPRIESITAPTSMPRIPDMSTC